METRPKNLLKYKQILNKCYEFYFLRELIKRVDAKDFYNCHDICINLLSFWDAKNSITKEKEEKNKISLIRKIYNLILNEEENSHGFKNLKLELNSMLNDLENNIKDFLLENDIFPTSTDKYELIYLNISMNLKLILTNFLTNLLSNKCLNKYNKSILLMLNALNSLIDSLESVFTILFNPLESLSKKEEFTLYLNYLKQIIDNLAQNKEIVEEIVNKGNFYFEAITSSLNLEGDITCLIFAGEKDEYKRMRENFLNRKIV